MTIRRSVLFGCLILSGCEALPPPITTPCRVTANGAQLGMAWIASTREVTINAGGLQYVMQPSITRPASTAGHAETSSSMNAQSRQLTRLISMSDAPAGIAECRSSPTVTQAHSASRRSALRTGRGEHVSQ